MEGNKSTAGNIRVSLESYMVVGTVQ